jgi:hypothetical protein
MESFYIGYFSLVQKLTGFSKLLERSSSQARIAIAVLKRRHGGARGNQP